MKQMAEINKDKPFAIVGVNSDRDRSDLDSKLKENGINYRNAVDGSTSGPIATAWNVRGWPTVYVIDEKGVIRQKFVGVDPKKLDAIVEQLLSALGK